MVSIGGGAGIETQARIVGFAVEQSFVFLERLLVLARFIFAQGAGGRTNRGRRQEQQQHNRSRFAHDRPARQTTGDS